MAAGALGRELTKDGGGWEQLHRGLAVRAQPPLPGGPPGCPDQLLAHLVLTSPTRFGCTHVLCLPDSESPTPALGRGYCRPGGDRGEREPSERAPGWLACTLWSWGSTQTPKQRDFPPTLTPAWSCCRLRLPSVSPQKPPLPVAHPLPTHMTVTRWLTPPPLPQGWTGSNLPSPHTWARRAEDQRERRAAPNGLVPDGWG